MWRKIILPLILTFSLQGRRDYSFHSLPHEGEGWGEGDLIMSSIIKDLFC
jgi:hypothetical protein